MDCTVFPDKTQIPHFISGVIDHELLHRNSYVTAVLSIIRWLQFSVFFSLVYNVHLG